MSAQAPPPATDGPRARVLAVDDDAPFLALLSCVLDATGLLEAAGEADSGEHAVAAAFELRPDMVLMDVRMPGLGGVEAARRIKAARPSTLVVLISTTRPDELPLDPAESFVDAVIGKSELEPKLLDEIWLRHQTPVC
jgi:two-component system, NarL family, invasion response regulator UvrY